MMQSPTIINIRVAHLRPMGYTSLEQWLHAGPHHHIYIGRNMTAYVKGAKQSKWHNPYPVKKYGLKDSLQRYEQYARANLYDHLDELNAQVMGCWCKDPQHPEIINCHGDILI